MQYINRIKQNQQAKMYRNNMVINQINTARDKKRLPVYKIKVQETTEINRDGPLNAGI